MVDALTDGPERARIAASLAASRGADRVALTFSNNGHPETQQDDASKQSRFGDVLPRPKTVMLRCRGSSSASGDRTLELGSNVAVKAAG
jgi:hypothetical protein